MPAPVATFPTYESECRRAVHDGFIWPFARDAMRNPEAIEERMAFDLSALLDERGADAVITSEDYLRKGWARKQVERHALEAARRLAAVKQARARARDLAHEVA